MPKKRDDGRIDENTIDSQTRPIHSEAMHATLGDAIGEVGSIREHIADDERSESVDVARSRLRRSLSALAETVRRSASDVGSALRGTSASALVWIRAERRRLALPHGRAGETSHA